MWLRTIFGRFAYKSLKTFVRIPTWRWGKRIPDLWSALILKVLDFQRGIPPEIGETSPVSRTFGPTGSLF